MPRPRPSSLSDFSARIYSSKFFSKLDLRKGYFQIPKRPTNILKTAIITLFELFKLLCLSFGLRNTAQTFQRKMDKIFGNLLFCFIYLDNILVFSNSLASHQQHLRRVFDLCCLHGLTINLENCTFAASQDEYLGQSVSSFGSRPLSKHLSAISNFPTPANCPTLPRFVSMVNFYRKVICGAALLLCP